MTNSFEHYPAFLEKYAVDITQSVDPSGMASVYLGKDEEGQEFVAKTVEIHPQYNIGLYRNRFENLQNLQHPNLLPITQFYEFQQSMITQVMQMPYCPMRSLDQQLDLQPDTIKLIIDQLIDALSYLHDHDIAWQNLSCKHILLEYKYGNHIPRIINYGNNIPIPLPYFTDYEYLAPEQFDAEYQPDIRTDFWALSVLIYKLYTGRLPFGQKTASLPNSKIEARILGDWEPGLLNSIPEPYQTIAIKGMHRKKEARWSNCGQIIAVIKNYTPSVQPNIQHTVTESTQGRRVLRVPNRPVNWLIVLLLFVFAAVLGYWLNHL